MRKQINKIIFIGIAVFSTGAFSDNRCGWKIASIVSGMTIDICESYSTVQVRAQSMAVFGGCAIKATAWDRSIQFIAPPTGMGDWHDLFDATAEVKLNIELEPLCDAEVVGEVRYFGRSK